MLQGLETWRNLNKCKAGIEETCISNVTQETLAELINCNTTLNKFV